MGSRDREKKIRHYAMKNAPLSRGKILQEERE
jgi:hypothetical protein